MINGLVNINYEAILRLSIEDAQQQLKSIDAIVNTAFIGYLGLPQRFIQDLQLLPFQEDVTDDVTSSPGKEIYGADIIWDDQALYIPVNVVKTEPIVGMRLLRNHTIQIQVTQNGIVTVDRL